MLLRVDHLGLDSLQVGWHAPEENWFSFSQQPFITYSFHTGVGLCEISSIHVACKLVLPLWRSCLGNPERWSTVCTVLRVSSFLQWNLYLNFPRVNKATMVWMNWGCFMTNFIISTLKSRVWVQADVAALQDHIHATLPSAAEISCDESLWETQPCFGDSWPFMGSGVGSDTFRIPVWGKNPKDHWESRFCSHVPWWNIFVSFCLAS